MPPLLFNPVSLKNIVSGLCVLAVALILIPPMTESSLLLAQSRRVGFTEPASQTKTNPDGTYTTTANYGNYTDSRTYQPGSGLFGRDTLINTTITSTNDTGGVTRQTTTYDPNSNRSTTQTTRPDGSSTVTDMVGNTTVSTRTTDPAKGIDQITTYDRGIFTSTRTTLDLPTGRTITTDLDTGRITNVTVPTNQGTATAQAPGNSGTVLNLTVPGVAGGSPRSTILQGTTNQSALQTLFDTGRFPIQVNPGAFVQGVPPTHPFLTIFRQPIPPPPQPIPTPSPAQPPNAPAVLTPPIDPVTGRPIADPKDVTPPPASPTTPPIDPVTGRPIADPKDVTPPPIDITPGLQFNNPPPDIDVVPTQPTGPPQGGFIQTITNLIDAVFGPIFGTTPPPALIDDPTARPGTPTLSPLPELPDLPQPTPPPQPSLFDRVVNFFSGLFGGGSNDTETPQTDIPSGVQGGSTGSELDGGGLGAPSGFDNAPQGVEGGSTGSELEGGQIEGGGSGFEGSSGQSEINEF